MSITDSKRVSLHSFWAFLSVRVRRDVLILIGQPIKYDLDNVDISAKYLSLVDDWHKIPEDIQEKIYNLAAKL